jgi:photosystem II stability/assembly factor-like uncharacterized protein
MPIAPRSVRSRALPLLALGALLGVPLASAASAPSSAPSAPYAALRWRNVGPWIGGRVVAVAGVEQDPDLFYMGAVDGGVWRSTDYGNRWVNITDRTLPGSSESIGAIAVAPSNPKILYVGTGESDIRGDVITGDGVFRSSDAGKTWQRAGLTDTHTISALVVDPSNPEVVYAAAMGHVFKSNPERGVFKSTDGGKSWQKILYVNAQTGAIDLVMDPRNPKVLYAALWQAYRTPWKLEDGGPGSGLYKSVDGGAHWQEISHNPGFPRGLLGRIGISVAASDPNVLYSIVQAKHGGVFRSDDGGAHWRRVNRSWSLRQRAFYYMTIYADPTDPNTVYVPEVDALWVSHDGGEHFAMLHTPHGDNHIVWINPRNPKILLEGNDGGATVSTDGGKTWSTEHNQPTGQFYHVALDNQFPFNLYGAQQDEGSFEGPSATADGMVPLSAWHGVAYNEATFVAPDPRNPEVTCGSGYFSILVCYDKTVGQFNDVSPWPDYQEGAPASQMKYRFGWTHPIFFSPTDPHTLLLASQYVLESDDLGRTWRRISPDLTRNVRSTEGPSGGPINLDASGAEIFPDISALAVSPRNAKVIWAGSADGLVHLTRDGGEHWQAVTPPALPEWTEINAIVPSAAAAGTAYLSASRYMWDDFHPYVFETTDYGAHWQQITTGLPARQYVLSLAQDPRDPSLLFAGTKNTVYVSLNSGRQWQPLTLNLPRVQVRGIAIDTRQGQVAIATHGRALWILDNLTLLEQLTHHRAPAPDLPALYAPASAWLSHAYGQSAYTRRVGTAGTNPPFGATVFFHIPADYHGQFPVRLSFLDAAGQTIRSFALHLAHPAPKLSAAVRDNRTPAEAYAAAQTRATGITPGNNRFQWNLRYPDATDVTGFWTPVAAGGLPDSVIGPTVLPGEYTVVLDYHGERLRAPLVVKLDPRLHPSAADLQARLALQMRIHAALNTLDATINRAIALRQRVKAAIGKVPANVQALKQARTALDAAIANVVQLKTRSSEGTLLFETKVRSHLAYLAAEIDQAYVRPTPAEYAVFAYLNGKARTGEQQLNSAIAAGARAL